MIEVLIALGTIGVLLFLLAACAFGLYAIYWMFKTPHEGIRVKVIKDDEQS